MDWSLFTCRYSPTTSGRVITKMIVNVTSDLDFAYKGFQYPIPPTWKYAVRVQDQINWLLQAVCALDAEGVNTSELTAAIEQAIDTCETYTDAKDAATRDLLAREVSRLEEWINSIASGAYYTRNPVDGNHEPIYVALKMMYDALRVKALTWDEFDALEKTYDEWAADGHTWIEFDLFSNVYYGDGQERAKWTDPESIDTETPGFFTAGTVNVGRTWDDMSRNGFLMIGGAR